MDNILFSIILGIIQGLTEFLPVSSSGHIELAKFFLDYSPKNDGNRMLLTVVLHAATALSTIVVFRKEISEIIKGLFQFKNNKEFQYSMKIIVSMIPAVIVGLTFEGQMNLLFDRNIALVGFMLLITALLLYLADHAKKTDKEVSYLNAIIIGVSQTIAILPGISRSGATISTSVMLGIDRERAARFSFLMVVPLILGKMSKDILSGEITYSSEILVPLIAGFIASFLTGLVACMWMIKLVKNSKLTYFSIYCIIVALIAMGFGAYTFNN
jgi:undecaprenyl-diphosphatase